MTEGVPTFFDEKISIEALAERQGVVPLKDPCKLFGTWPCEIDDGLEELICDLRNRNTTGSSLR